MADSKGKKLRLADSRQNKNADFKFAESKTHIVFTLKQIVENKEPILFVIHDSDEADWQFLSGKPVSQKDLVVVPLQSLVSADGSLNELADLPQGWYATRESLTAEWKRKVIDDEQ
jgi:hypothetical protein